MSDVDLGPLMAARERCIASVACSSLWSQLRLLIVIALMGLSGCSGCLPTQQEKLSREELEKRRREQREAIEIFEMVSLPADSETKTLTAKPGHWLETQQQFKSNREDLQVVAVASIARGAKPVELSGTSTINDYARRTSLPKGQTKTIDLQSYVPIAGTANEPRDEFNITPSKLTYHTDLLSWPLMTPILQSPVPKPANELEPHEFQLFVMSPQALSYEYLTVLDAVYWRQDDGLMQEERTRSYYVALVKPKDNRYSIPQSMLTMTAVAVIIWDDVSPDDLSIEQQNAMIDWLHFGGQLLISGPSSWSRLQNSFLSPYLPAATAETSEFASADFSDLSNHWVVDDISEKGLREPLEIVGSPIGGLRFKLNDKGNWLPGAGEMVAESQVGRGRIVVTAFPMREPRIYRWKYYGSFFSTGLLRRHPREIRRSPENSMLQQMWVKPYGNASFDPRLHSNFRILSRDLPLSNRSSIEATQARGELATPAFPAPGSRAVEELSAEERPSLNRNPNSNSVEDASRAAEVVSRVDPTAVREDMRWGGGGAAWNDFSGLSNQAVIALRSAAGIELPSRATILYLLGGYLICLVPLNWLIFRALRRLEFAWIAAPILALIGVGVVTKVASLDIGFARRTTEISLLELHGDHPRGHLTKFLALYTSLSTNYAVEFPETDSVALPLADFGRTQSRAVAATRKLRTAYGSSDGVRLEPVTVYSNSTEMLHAEQLITLPGSFSLSDSTGASLRNGTGLSLQAALVVRCLPTGEIEQAWIGELPSGQETPLHFAATNPASMGSKWESEIATQKQLPSTVGDETLADSLWVGGMLHEVLQKTPLVAGQSRLIGYTDDRPGRLQIKPTEDQFDGRCVVVAHLTPPDLGETVPDRNILGRLASSVSPAASGSPDDDSLDGETARDEGSTVSPSLPAEQPLKDAGDGNL